MSISNKKNIDGLTKNHETQIDQLAKKFTYQQKDAFNANTQKFTKEHWHSAVVDQDEELMAAKDQEKKKKKKKK